MSRDGWDLKALATTAIVAGRIGADNLLESCPRTLRPRAP